MSVRARDYQEGKIDRNVLLETLEHLQSLFLRKMIVGETRDHLIAQLCRKRTQYGYPIREMVRRAPSDERIRSALKHQPLPHAGYVLQRLEPGVPPSLLGLEIEHIFPQGPTSAWSGDGVDHWGTLNEEGRARYRELLNTIGNLALLEQPLNAGASNKSFGDKKSYYEQSKIGSIRALASPDAVWNVKAIEQRTEDLTTRFLQIWRRPRDVESEGPDYLVPILDAQKKFGTARVGRPSSNTSGSATRSWKSATPENSPSGSSTGCGPCSETRCSPLPPAPTAPSTKDTARTRSETRTTSTHAGTRNTFSAASSASWTT